jgi:hypothetical protein
MRVAAIRTDMSSIYVNDIENRAQRCFSSEPAGQSLYLKKASDEQLLEVYNTYGFATIQGSDTAPTIDTSTHFTLSLKTSAGASYVAVNVRQGVATTKANIIVDLNAGFAASGLALKAFLDNNKVTIQTTGAVCGEKGYVALDTVGQLDSNLGLSNSPVVGVSFATFKAAIYTGGTVNVSTAGISAIGSLGLMVSADLTALVNAVADLVAPKLVETGPVLLSFVYGTLSKYVSSSFAPGAQYNRSTQTWSSNSHVSQGTGAAVVCLANDGVTPFTLG